MRKFLSLLVILLVSTFTIHAEIISGNCGKEGDNVTYTLDTETGVMKIEGRGKMKNNFLLYDLMAYIKSIQILEGVTNIGDVAFGSCSYLTSISIPSTVVSIGTVAFAECSSLNYINITSNVTSIGDDAFYGCYFLSSNFVNNSSCYDANNWGATLVDTETDDGLLISNNKVVKCRTNATSITIPEGVTSIGDRAFEGCSSLNSINIPSNVTSIGDDAFSSCM